MKRVTFEVKGKIPGLSRKANYNQFKEQIACEYISQHKDFIQDETFVMSVNCYYKNRGNKEGLVRKDPNVDDIIRVCLDGLKGVAFADKIQCNGVFVGKLWDKRNYIEITLSKETK